jgi:hypothetical protein
MRLLPRSATNRRPAESIANPCGKRENFPSVEAYHKEALAIAAKQVQGLYDGKKAERFSHLRALALRRTLAGPDDASRRSMTSKPTTCPIIVFARGAERRGN